MLKKKIVLVVLCHHYHTLWNICRIIRTLLYKVAQKGLYIFGHCSRIAFYRCCPFYSLHHNITDHHVRMRACGLVDWIHGLVKRSGVQFPLLITCTSVPLFTYWLINLFIHLFISLFTWFTLFMYLFNHYYFFLVYFFEGKWGRRQKACLYIR